MNDFKDTESDNFRKINITQLHKLQDNKIEEFKIRSRLQKSNSNTKYDINNKVANKQVNNNALNKKTSNENINANKTTTQKTNAKNSNNIETNDADILNVLKNIKLSVDRYIENLNQLNSKDISDLLIMSLKKILLYEPKISNVDLIEIINKGLLEIPEDNIKLHLILGTDDYKNFIEKKLLNRINIDNLILVEDVNLNSGDFKIESATGHVVSSKEKRLNTIIQLIGDYYDR